MADRRYTRPNQKQSEGQAQASNAFGAAVRGTLIIFALLVVIFTAIKVSPVLGLLLLFLVSAGRLVLYLFMQTRDRRGDQINMMAQRFRA